MDKDTEVQTNLKIPKSLKEKLKVAAKENHRSMTAELIARLEESFGSRSVADAEKPAAQMSVHEFLEQQQMTVKKYLEEQELTVKQHLEAMEKLQRGDE